MAQVLEIARLLAVTADLDRLLTAIAESATQLLDAERASIYLHDPPSRQLWTRVALGAREIRVPDTAGIVGHVFQTNRLLRVARPYEDPRFNPEIDRRSGFVTRNLLTAPARDMSGRPIGVLQVVNRKGGEFTEYDEALIDILAGQVGVAIQRHYLQQQTVQAAALRHEMELAQRVQLAMIPAQPPRLAGLAAAGWTRPASLTGGDAYDLWITDDGRMGVFLGDASGHGIAPALVVSQARTLVRALSEMNSDPAWLLTRLNARLARDLEAGTFVTVFLAFVDGSGSMQWCSAGHGPVFLRVAADTPLRLLEPTAPPIGVLPELECDGVAREQIQPGGMLAVMSDGVFEARSPERELFTVERLVGFLEGSGRCSPARIIESLRQILIDWQGREEPEDDQTVAIVQRVE